MRVTQRPRMTRLPGQLSACKLRYSLWTLPAWGAVPAQVTCDTCRRYRPPPLTPSRPLTSV